MGSKSGHREERKQKGILKLFQQTTKASLIHFYFSPNIYPGICTCQTEMILFGNLRHISPPCFPFIVPPLLLVQLTQSGQKQATLAQLHAFMRVATLTRTWCLCGGRAGWSSGWTQEFPAEGPGPLARTHQRTASHFHGCLSKATDCPTLSLLSF